MRSVLPLFYLFVLGTNGAGASEPNLPFMVYLDQAQLVCLKWGFDSLQQNITFKLVVNTTGWVGFGFSPNGGMAGADIVMGGLKADGSYFKDYYATGNSMPQVDNVQSYTLLSMNESDGQTSMTFQRSVLSCDDQDFQITAQPIKLIYAYGTSDDISYHAALRGTMEVNLLNYMPKTSVTNLNYLSAKVNNMNVPATHTHYHCKVMQFTKLPTKHHVIKIEPVIENSDIVHHMLLYRCPAFVTQPYEGPCYMGNIGDTCFGVVAAWAVGGGAMEFPENAGIPVGGDDSDTFYRLEIHYNNPNNETGRTDNSGLRLYYTDELRQNDVGILFTGLLVQFQMEYKIPAKAAQFHTYGVCNTSMFSQLENTLPDLNVFAVVLHTHLAGRKVRVGHFRNGTQFDFLGINENYDFNLQQMINLGSIKTIKPGDDIVVECTYSTTDRSGITKMGLGTTEEMCLAFLLYYPAISINTCASHPNTTDPSMNASSQMFAGNSTLAESEITEYETLLKTVPQQQIIGDDNLRFAVNENGVVKEMMPTPTVTCQNNVNNASRRLSASWMVSPAAIILLLLWIAIM